jgi:hypothetical protein
MVRHTVFLTVAFFLLVSVGVGSVGGVEVPGDVFETSSGQVIGSPDVEVVVPEDDIVPGKENEIEFYVLNEGDIERSGPTEYVDRVTTARSATVEFTSRDEDIDVVSGKTPVGSLPTGEKGPYTVRLDVDEDIQEGDHRLYANVEYSYTRFIEYGTRSRMRDSTQSQSERLSVEVREDARFRIEDTSFDARLGEKGDATLTLRNRGSVGARDAVVSLSSPTSTVSFEDDASDIEASVGYVEAGGSTEVEFPLRFSRDANVRGQSLTATVRYEDAKGIERESRSLTPSFTPDAEQLFEVRDVSSGLRSGTVGWLSGELVNIGGEEVDDVVLRHIGGTNIDLRDTSVAIGDIDPGETREFTLRVGVPSGVSSDKGLSFVPEYTRDGDEYEARPVRFVASVAQHRDEFGVRGTDASVVQGEETTVEFEVRNGMDENVRNVTAVAVSDEPAEIESSDAFIGELSPGETATVTFDVDADSDATPRAYPVRFSFGFTDAAGETRTATGVASVEVVEDETRVPFEDALVGIVVVVLLLGLGWWVYGKDFVARRRN